MELDCLFCSECHNILDLPGIQPFVSCYVCGKSHSASIFESKEITSTSTVYAHKGTADGLGGAPRQDELKTTGHGATIKEKCPNCNHNELSFSTMQLRSADEGQTIFYRCLKCNHKFSVNS